MPLLALLLRRRRPTCTVQCRAGQSVHVEVHARPGVLIGTDGAAQLGMTIDAGEMVSVITETGVVVVVGVEAGQDLELAALAHVAARGG